MLGYILGFIILVAAGAGLILYLRKKFLNSAFEMKAAQTSTIAELKGIYDDMDAAGAGNTYRHFVELNGTIVADPPARTPYSETNVAFYTAKLVQVYEETSTYQDSNGRTQTRNIKKERDITNETSSSAVKLMDTATGESVYLDMTASGIKLDLYDSFDRFESKNNLNNYSYFHSFNFGRYGSETLGYRMIEETMPQNQQVYVIGEAYRRGNDIYIGRPTDTKKPFIVSYKSEEELTKAHTTNALIALVAGIGCIIAGFGTLIYGIVEAVSK